MPPIYILNIYAHSDNYRARNHLFDQIISLLNSMPEMIPSLIIAGDMNCCFDSTSQRYNRQTGKPKSFIEFLNTHFSDCLNQPNLPHDYTFRRGSSLSTLDYMFASRDAFFKMSDGDTTFLSQEWTDHALLTKTYTTGMTNCGKGVWRANPFLAKNPIYVNKLNTAISNYVETKLDPNLSAQEKWDLIKKKTKQVTQNFSRTHCSWRKAKIKKLQSERNNLLHRYRNDSVCFNLLLSPVEKELSKLQQEVVDVQRLRAGQRWHEKSEKSPGYIKQTLAEKASKRTVSSLKHPTSGEQCWETSTKLDAAKVFYQDLYTEEEIDLNCVERMLQYIDKTIPAEDSQGIIEDIPLRRYHSRISKNAKW
ncbi:Uridine kinase [Mucor velutinosus]|uniref:Uridine kinase n=1 Tax=Mucor velutinosus TaxID=708070 RepID=A0AAN7DQW0_9FUNG|nr:Uridine kinase [Mucor velutinosus]